MSDLLKWILLLPVAFAGYAISSYLIGFIGGQIRKVFYSGVDINQLIAFFIAGFVFVLLGNMIAPNYKIIISCVLLVIMVLVNITSPARLGGRISQIIGSSGSFLLTLTY